MTVRGRYAPSPSGPLHLGNVRTALIAWLHARLHHGTFVMRIEDLDAPRTVAGSAEQILDDLDWLGLDWDEGPFWQAERNALYVDAFERLERGGHVFRCWCSRKDIAEAASAPHEGSPIYAGTCREITTPPHDRPPASRYRVTNEEIAFVDEVLGEFRQNLATDVGDFVVRRAGGVFAYQLAVVVDDIDMGITDIVRGDDLLDSTPRQIALYRALGAEPPRFWHVPMMTDSHGARMSKRDGSQSLQELRAAGWTVPRVVGHLAASLGWCNQDEELGAAELCERLRADVRCFRDGLRR